MNINSTKDYKYILGQRVDYTTYHNAVDKIIKYSNKEKSSYICASNVHMVMESHDNNNFQNIINNANIVTPDGIPLVWTLKLLGVKNAERVYGPKLMIELLKMCALKNIPVGLYGGKKEVLDKLVKQLPKKYETFVGEHGVRLSGGQRQRIGIARALYKNASVLIFDEATSALDNETEQSVMQAIEELDDDITLFIIAHRLTTLKKCTHIVELSEGKVKRIGGYHELIDS